VPVSFIHYTVVSSVGCQAGDGADSIGWEGRWDLLEEEHPTDIFIVSGSPPTAPVVSKTSGSVYEKALIERYIEENGTDPISGEALTMEDLIDVKASQSRPSSNMLKELH
jgi:hypothetical protein